MTKEIFLEKLRDAYKDKKVFFVVAAQTDTDMTVVAIEQFTQYVILTFRYSEQSNIVYRLHLVDGSIYTGRDIINTLYDLTTTEEDK